jgi:hypothetical protein
LHNFNKILAKIVAIYIETLGGERGRQTEKEAE